VESRASVGDELSLGACPTTVDSTAVRVRPAEDEPAELSADDDEGAGWPGPIDEPPPLFS
jgi:hypothetical protein